MRRNVFSSALTALSLLALGCNLVVDTSTHQCETDADCAAKGPGFEGTLCTAEKVCGRITCTTHQECSERLGESAYCRPSDSTCSKIGSVDCTGGVLPPKVLTQDNVILIGFLGQLRDDYLSYGTPLKEGAELALHDIETNANGLPGVDGSSPRHLAMVLCHDMDDPVRAAQHLVNDLGVPAIVGPAFSSRTLQVVHDTSLHKRLLVITASATTPALSSERSPYFWRTVPSDAIQAKALAKLVQPSIDVLMERKQLTADQQLSLAVAYIDNAYGNGISRSFFEGASNLDVTAVTYPEPSTSSDSKWKDTDAPRAVDRILAAKPHIVVGLATTEFDTDLIPGIEKKKTSDPTLPLYLLPEGARVSELSAAVTMHGLNGRLLGTAPGARRSDDYTTFASAFQATFSHAPGNLAEFAYDAAYLIAYAIAISNAQQPTASELADAMSRVTCTADPKVGVTAGPKEFKTNFNRAADTRCIDFTGVSGELQFDPVTHEAPSDIEIWCPLPNGDIVKSPAYYAAATDEISGKVNFSCGVAP